MKNENLAKKPLADNEAEPIEDRIAETLAAIDSDASAQPERYLRETEVPAGGE